MFLNERKNLSRLSKEGGTHFKTSGLRASPSELGIALVAQPNGLIEGAVVGGVSDTVRQTRRFSERGLFPARPARGNSSGEYKGVGMVVSAEFDETGVVERRIRGCHRGMHSHPLKRTRRLTTPGLKMLRRMSQDAHERGGM